MSTTNTPMRVRRAPRRAIKGNDGSSVRAGYPGIDDADVPPKQVDLGLAGGKHVLDPLRLTVA